MEPTNEPGNLPIWVSILIAILSSFATGIGAWLINVFKAKKEIEITGEDADSKRKIGELDKAVALFRELATSLREDMRQLTDYNNKLEKEYMATREENVRLKLTLDMIAGKKE